MTKKKRGRPFGGRNPEAIRAYWRQVQRDYRARTALVKQGKKFVEKVTGKKGTSCALKRPWLILMRKENKKVKFYGMRKVAVRGIIPIFGA